MSIVNELIEKLVEKNGIDLSGTFTVSVVPGGVTVKGRALTVVIDRPSKEIFRADTDINMQLSVGELVIPLPRIK